MPLFTSEYVFSDDYPTIEPSLKLDFANARALDPRITFTRASTATYVGRDGLVRYAGEDEARFDHDPETGESLGLLIEESRSNLVTYSSDMSQWTSNGGIVASDDTTAPDGTLTADKLTESSGGFNGQYNGGTITLSTNTTYSVASFIKPVDQPTTRFGIYSGSLWYAFVDTNWDANGNPTTNNSSGASNVKYESYSNGWYRASFTFTTPSSVSAFQQYHHHPDRTGSGKSAWFWGAQLELGSFPTSYIPTSGSTATRAVDDAVIQGENFNSFFNPSEGSIICKYKKDHWPIAAGNSIQYERVWEIGDGTDTNNLNIFNDPTQTSGNNIRYRVRTSSTNVFGPTTVTTGTNQTPTVALGYAKDNFVLVIDGTLVAADTSGDLPVVDRLHIGGRYGGDSFDRFNNTISKLFYYPKRITVAQLQTLTQ